MTHSLIPRLASFKPRRHLFKHHLHQSPVSTSLQSRPTTLCNRPPPPKPYSTCPVQSSTVNDLSECLPCFRSLERHVEVLEGPREFYRSLLDMISGARRRIFIASLYIGKEENELVEALIRALERSKNLELTVLVDYLRSTREHPRPSSASLLAQLKNRFPSRVDIRLFHTPELFGLQKALIPRRFNEGWGLQHMKIYGADEQVIMSGANLSRDYFTNRQDRYISFSHQVGLTDYLAELCQTTCSMSYRLEESADPGDLRIVWPESNAICQPIDSRRASAEFKSAGRERFGLLTERWRRKAIEESNRSGSAAASEQVSILPVLQMGPFRIDQETSVVVPKLIQVARSLSSSEDGWKTRLHWTSGYFSLLREYKQQLLVSETDVRIITASPEANGFFESKGVSRYIPSAYTYLEHLFYKAICLAGKQDRIKIREWSRPGWTYHAKGLWIVRSNESEQTCMLATIGSSNFGRRSAERDLECNLVLINHDTNGKVSRALVGELDKLEDSATGVVDEKLFRKKERRVGWAIKLATRLIRNKL